MKKRTFTIEWVPVQISAAGAENARTLFEAQSYRPFPAFWIPANPFAVHFKLKPAEGTAEITLRAGEIKLGRWAWGVDGEVARPRGLHLDERLDPSTGREEALFWKLALERRAQILVATFERLAVTDDDNLFAGMGHCGLCHRALIDSDSRALGIGPECVQKFRLRRSKRVVALVVGKRGEAAEVQRVAEVQR